MPAIRWWLQLLSLCLIAGPDGAGGQLPGATDRALSRSPQPMLSGRKSTPTSASRRRSTSCFSPRVRRDATAPHPEFVLGPNLDIALWNFLTNLKTNNPERSKYLTLRIGYRYAKNLYERETSNEDGRAGIDATRAVALGLPDRRSQPYRSPRPARLASTGAIETGLRSCAAFPIRSFAITPYAQVEAFYNCSLGEWSQYAYTFGAISRIIT